MVTMPNPETWLCLQVETITTTSQVNQQQFSYGELLKDTYKILTSSYFYRLQPASPEKLLKAFLTLDRDRKGYLTKEFLSKIMMEEGEPFTQEELDEMMAAAIDGETGNILYEYYINQLMVRIVL